MNFALVNNLLDTPKKVVITAHRNPDGDALGSSLGAYHLLRAKGHSVQIVLPSEYPESFGWLPGIEEVVIYDLHPEIAKHLVEKAEVVFCLDFNSLDRIDKLGELIQPDQQKVILIDHHINPSDFAWEMLSDTTASSTCELIYDFMQGLGWAEVLDEAIGTCLYTGIITDTGSFKFSTSAKLFRIVAALLEVGVDDYALQDRIFNCLEEKSLRLLGHALANRLEILPEFRTGIIYLNRDDYEHFNIQRGDTEGIVNYILKIKNMDVAAFITEQPNIVKISLRSKGTFSVQEIAKNHFKGGGHRNAAGGYSYQSLGKTIRRFKEVLPKYRQIQASDTSA